MLPDEFRFREPSAQGGMKSLSNSAFSKALRRLAQAVCRRRAWFVYPQLGLAVLCLLYTARSLKLDMNRDDLLSPNSKYQKVYLALEKEFPGEGNDLAVAVESDEPGRNRQFIERLAMKIKPDTNLFSDIFYKGDPTTLGPKGLLLASTNDLAGMRDALHAVRPLLAQFAQATNLNSLIALINEQFRQAAFSGSKAGANLTNAIPFLDAIVNQATADMQQPGKPPPPELSAFFSGGEDAERQIYTTLDHGHTFLLAARPLNTAVTPAAIARLRRCIQETETEEPGVNVGLTGGSVLNYDEMEQAQRDTTRSSIVAFLICAAIFIVAYRQLRRPLKAACCLLIGLGYALGFATLTIGHLNILTITFAPMLIGLGIDFGIHFISRYEEETRRRRGETEAVERSMAFTGQGIVTGGLTTGAAFLAMAFTDFKGVQEMGIIAGGGLLLCLIPMMTTLPVFLMHGRENQRDYERGPGGQRRLRMELFWFRHPIRVLLAALCLTIPAGLALRHLTFDYDLLDLQNPRLASVQYEKKLIQSAGSSSLYGAVVADSATQAADYAGRLRKLPAVSEVRSAAGFMAGDQQKKVALVKAIKSELAGIQFAPVDRGPVNLDALGATTWYLNGYLGIAAQFAQSQAPAIARQLSGLRADLLRLRVVMRSGHGEAAEKLAEYQQGLFESFRDMISALQNEDTTGPLRAEDLPAPVRDRFIGRTGKYLLEVYSKQNLWRHENQKAFIDQLESVIPSSHVTGDPVQLYEYTTLLKNSYEQAALYAFAAIVIMVLIHFRSLLWLALALLPVAIGAVWLVGFMSVAHLSFNPANIMTLPLALGVGVTNGIQMLNRFAEEGAASILTKSTGKAVLVSGLTAIAGFGSLILAGDRGIRSLGAVMSVGIASCMIAALTILPAILSLLTRRQERRRAAFETAPAHDLEPRRSLLEALQKPRRHRPAH